MSSCPSVRARNTGSGYVKESGGSSTGGEDAKQQLAARLAERAAQDARIWGPVETTPVRKIESMPSAAPSSHRKP